MQNRRFYGKIKTKNAFFNRTTVRERGNIMARLSSYECYYIYTGIGFDDCIANISDYKTALEVMRKNDTGTAYIVDSADRFKAGSFRSYLKSFNYNNTLA